MSHNYSASNTGNTGNTGNTCNTEQAEKAEQVQLNDATHSAIDNAERRVIRQYVEALLFEQIVAFDTEEKSVSDLKPKPLSEERIKPLSDLNPEVDDVFKLRFNFRLGRIAFRALGALSAFDRVRLAPGSIECYSVECGKWCEANLASILDAQEMTETARARLKQELMQTLALCRWNDQHLSQHKNSRRQLDFQALESAIVEGHLYHPCFKTRTGFTEQDHEMYGPEAANTFQLQWLALKRNSVDANFPGTEAVFWLKEIGENSYQKLSQRAAELGITWAEFTLMPIHPWQYKAILSLGLDDEIQQQNIYNLGAEGDFYQASQSLRTLVNMSDPKKANIKIPLNVICTSSHRNLQSHFVHTAPVISTWLQGLVASDTYLQEKNNALLLSEYAGFLYEPMPDKKSLSGRIGVIFRESVVDKLEANQQALPFSALMLIESDGQPFISDWLAHYGVEAWVERLLETMLVPIWHMLAHHGVAFEAHSQNLLLIHRDGWPEKIVLRDFHEDSEFVAEFLQDPKNLPELAAVDTYFDGIALDEGFAMADIEALRELFMDTVYVFNLADLAFLLERTSGFNENGFWALVKSHLDAYASSGVTSAERIQQVGVEQEIIVVESLLKKKIMDGGTLDYYEHSVTNRLHERCQAKETVSGGF